MACFTGYLLGKVQLDGAIRSEVLANLVETLMSNFQTSDSSKRHFKFNETHKYCIECSERGLKLTAPAGKSKDEGFESDCDSIRSVRVEVDLSRLMNHLEISTGGSPKGSDSGAQSPSSPGGSVDNSSLLSSSAIQVSDDGNSSSGNGSDSDEFNAGGCTEHSISSSPYWESMANNSPSFQSYPIEDVVFCHCDALQPSTLVWVVRHLEKMVGVVTFFRSRTEAEHLFQTYRELRAKFRPVVRYKLTPTVFSLNPETPVLPTAELHESTTNPSCLFSNQTQPNPNQPRSLISLEENLQRSFNSAEDNLTIRLFNPNPPRSLTSEEEHGSVLRPFGAKSTRSLTTALEDGLSVRSFNPNLTRSFTAPEESLNSASEEAHVLLTNQEEGFEDTSRHSHVGRKVKVNGTTGSLKGPSKPVLLVPLKTDSAQNAKSTYPKESYLYQVIGPRSSSTFAPYQRSMNFVPFSATSANELSSWNGGTQLLVPFSSWLELSELPNKGTIRKGSLGSLYPKSGRMSGKTSRGISGAVGAKGTTSRILLRDAVGGRDSMWASLSQRFKRNVRETLIPKLNGIWSQGQNDGPRPKKRTAKKVTFNAWATVQMV